MTSVAGGFRGSYCVTEIVPAMTEIQAGLEPRPEWEGVSTRLYLTCVVVSGMSLAESDWAVRDRANAIVISGYLDICPQRWVPGD